MMISSIFTDDEPDNNAELGTDAEHSLVRKAKVSSGTSIFWKDAHVSYTRASEGTAAAHTSSHQQDGGGQAGVQAGVKAGVSTESQQESLRACLSVDATKLRQEVIGFGASFTDAAAYLINTVLPTQRRRCVMTALFDPHEGIGLSAVRNPMGSSDYARFIYSYDDVAAGQVDAELEHFSVEHDEKDVIPLTRMARELNPDLFVMASPWSAPAWMKTSGSMKTGQLKPEFHQAYARYFVRFIEEMQARGITIDAITPQNEPLYEPKHYPGMLMPAGQEKVFIHQFLAPALRQAGLSTQILAYDHNWDKPEYPLEVLETAEADVSGIAWHWYGGEASAQALVQKRYPHADVYCTEASGGSWIAEPSLMNLANQIISAFTYGSRTFILWNMALDENNGPTVPGFGTSTCRGLFTVDTATRSAEPTVDFYGLAHFSTVIRPGARVVTVKVQENGAEPSDYVSQCVKTLAALNKDGSIGVVALNEGEKPVELSIAGKPAINLLLPAQSVVSFELASN